MTVFSQLKRRGARDPEEEELVFPETNQAIILEGDVLVEHLLMELAAKGDTAY